MRKFTYFSLSVVLLATGAHAATLPEAQTALCSKSGAELATAVTTLSSNTTVDTLTQAMLNCPKSFTEIIASMRAAQMPDQVISNSLYRLVPAARLAELDGVVLIAGLPMPATGAGPGGPNPGGFNGNGQVISPFVSSSTGGTGGGRASRS